jgi:hypothetical protein
MEVIHEAEATKGNGGGGGAEMSLVDGAADWYSRPYTAKLDCRTQPAVVVLAAPGLLAKDVLKVAMAIKTAIE